MQGQFSGARGHGRGQGGDHPYVSIATKYADIIAPIASGPIPHADTISMTLSILGLTCRARKGICGSKI